MEHKTLLKSISRWLSAVITVLAIPVLAGGQPAATTKLIVEADEASGGTGVVKVALWRDEKTFLKGDPYRAALVEIKEGRATATFDGLPPGEYAVSAFHDKNNNGKLDTNFAGKPTEPYGFSNNARGTFGPPKFERARIRVEDNQTVSIHLN